MIFLLLAATGLASLVISADWIVKLLYDRRYWDAGWMLAVLSVGVWFSIICTINESSLLGFGKPQYAVYANTLKLIWLIAGLPTLVMAYGISGAVVAILLSDVWRYIPIFIGQHRERFSFGRQDIVLTAVFVTLIFVGEWIRQHLGFGLSFSAML